MESSSVAADPDRSVGDGSGKRDHRDLARPASDVDDHVARRRLHRKSDADGRRHRLRHHVDFLGAGGMRAGPDGPSFEFRDAGRHAHDDERPDLEEPRGHHFLEEVADHHLGDVHVGDHAVLQRPNRFDPAGRAAEHALGGEADPSMRPVSFRTATTDGSLRTMPSPSTCTRVFAVPRSTPILLIGRKLPPQRPLSHLAGRPSGPARDRWAEGHGWDTSKAANRTGNCHSG